MDYLETSRELLDFIAASPSMFHTIASIRRVLDEAGYAYLSESAHWEVEPGGAYYTVRNGSSLIAFRVAPELGRYHFKISASHADSPTFKVKSVPELEGPEGYLRLNVEGYGGMIDYTWLDRPLTVAGRALVEQEGSVTSRLVHVDRNLLLIPSVAVHMNRTVNEGFAFNHQVDLCPLVSAGELGNGAFAGIVADELGVEPEQVLASDLFLVNRQPGVVWGQESEFVSSPKLDDLQCAFAALKGFVGSHNDQGVAVYVCFDNEEVGSGTKQGALSTFLHDVLVRINEALGLSEVNYLEALSRSFLVSCDNAHAVHPNHPEHTDAQNHAVLNGGVVIKEHAEQRYCSDAFSRAAFLAVCKRAGVPTQPFANRSDKRGGSTLGNLSNTQVSVHGVDIGLPQLAMHSSYETAGVKDTAWAIQALQAFYDCDLEIEGAERFELR